MKKFLAPLPIAIGVLVVATSAFAAVRLLGASSHSLMLEWRLDEPSGTTALDSSTNGKTGTLYGAVQPSRVAGRWGGAVAFNGTDQYIENDTGIASLGTTNRPYTIATWVKVASDVTSANIIHVADHHTGYGWCTPFLVVNNHKFQAQGYNGGQTVVTSGDTLLPDQWYYVATTWDATNGLRLFVNGALVGSTPQGSYSASNQPDYIFAGAGMGGCIGDAGYLHGTMDDVRVYDAALSETKIHALYTNNTEVVATIHPRQVGLMGSFYAGTNFDTLVSTHADTTINFDPADDVIGVARAGQPDYFSARWTGFVTPQYSEDYTFTTVSDDGARLYVDGQLLVNDWSAHGPTPVSGTIHLLAGHAYPIQLEYLEYDGGATITLSWQSNSVPHQIVPASALSYDGPGTTVNDTRNTRVNTGLIGLWSFDGQDMDWTSAITGIARDGAQAHNGTLEGMSQRGSVRPGKIGQALDFDGVASCVQTSAQLYDNPTAFTVAGWIYPRSTGHASLFGQNDTAEFGFAGGDLQGWTAAGGNIIVSGTEVPLNHWHHVAFAVGTSSMRIYVDGEVKASSPGAPSGYGSVSADVFRIGCGVWGGSGQYFDGKIDDVRAYNRALTAGEIKQLYLVGT